MELYIHIPFCAKKCRYCDFLSFSGKEACFKDYIGALCEELESYRTLIREKGLDTVFIGGGTPSVLPADVTEALLKKINSLAEDAGKPIGEYTIECNPGTLDAGKLRLYRKYGINRLSIGLQSADDKELALLGRIHDHACFLDNYRLAREAGFDNINIDLISALPGQTLSSWERTLRSTAKLGPEHISAYSLIIEPGTPFFEIYGGDGRKPDDVHGDPGCCSDGDCKENNSTIRTDIAIHENLPPLPDEDTEREIYRMTVRILGEYGYGRYEISNYSKPGFESKHNLGYWTGADYIGAGLGASSYLCERRADGRLLNGVRFKNTDDLNDYIAGRRDRKEEESLTLRDLIGEYIMLHLRLTEGFCAGEFERLFGQSVYDLFGDVIAKYTELGLMEDKGGFIRLTEDGLDVSNAIMSEFI